MKISKQARREAKALFRSCIVNGVLDEDRVRAAAQALMSGKPRGYMGVLSHLQRLVTLDVARRTAKVETAVPISPAFQASVQENLTRSYGAGLLLSFEQKPDLIAGMRVQVGSDVYDGSAKARLAALEERFSNTSI